MVTTKADGMPHRLLRTEFVNGLEAGGRLRQLLPTLRRSVQFKKMSGLSWLALAKDGMSMKRSSGRSWNQMMLAANTPMLLKAGLVDGDTEAGMLASGQVVGVIDELPVVPRNWWTGSVDEAVVRLKAAAATVRSRTLAGRRHSEQAPQQHEAAPATPLRCCAFRPGLETLDDGDVGLAAALAHHLQAVAALRCARARSAAWS